MSCGSVRRRFTIEGGSRRLQEEDRAHLSRCNACADYVRGDESVRRLLGAARAPEPGPDFADRLIRRIHAAADQEPGSARSTPWRARWAYAVAAVVLVAAGWFGWGRGGTDSPPVVAPATVVVEAEPERSPPQPSEPVTFPLEPFRMPEFFVFQPPRPASPPVTGGEPRPMGRPRMVLHDESQP